MQLRHEMIRDEMRSEFRQGTSKSGQGNRSLKQGEKNYSTVSYGRETTSTGKDEYVSYPVVTNSLAWGGPTGTTEDVPQGIDAILSGLSDGITIFRGSMFGMFFPELKAEADRLVAQNGGLYAWSQTFNNIGSTALQLVLMNGAIKALGWGGQGISKYFKLDKFAQTMCAIGTTGRIAGTALAVGGTGYAAYSAVRHFGEAWNHLTQGGR